MNAIKSLGYTRAILTSGMQFNSLFLRTMVGMGRWLPAESISIITSIEFFLNLILEVPLGILADRFGRLPLIYFGLITITFSIITTGILSTIHDPSYQHQLMILTGILIGIGKPMYSGALEAYYQSFVAKHHEESKRHSFILSNLYAKYLTTIIVAITLIAIYVCIKQNSLLIGFALGTLAYLLLLLKIFLNSKEFGPETKSQIKRKMKLQDVLKKQLTLGYFLNAMFFFFGSIILNYLLTALMSKELHADQTTAYLQASSYIIGYLSLGWIAKAKVLPLVAKVKNRRKPLIISTLIYGFCIFGFAHTQTLELVAIRCLGLIIFGAATQIFLSYIKDTSINELFSNSPAEVHSSVLSAANIPGYLIAGTVPLIYAITHRNFPTISEMCLITGLASPVFAFLIYLFTKKGKSENHRIYK